MTRIIQVYTQLFVPPNVSDGDAWHREFNVTPAPIMYSSVIDPDEKGRFNTKRVAAWLEKHVPPKHDDLLVLDWEETGLSENPPRVEQALSLINFVRQYCPEAKIGYYLNHRLEKYEPIWKQLNPLIAASDVVLPSIYQFTQLASDDYDAFVEWCLSAGKPVYLYTWHRWHPADHYRPWKLIAVSQWLDHVRHFLSIEVNGNKPSGIILWGTDHYRVGRAFETDENGKYYAQTSRKWIDLRIAYWMEGLEDNPPWTMGFIKNLYEALFLRAHAAMEMSK